MNFYSYSESTGEYLGQGIALESPLEPGVYLIPANATQIVSPAASANQVGRFFSNGTTMETFLGFSRHYILGSAKPYPFDHDRHWGASSRFRYRDTPR